MTLEFPRQVFEKNPNIKFQGNPSSGSRVVPCGRDSQTDIMKLIVAFLNFAKAPNNKWILLKTKIDPNFLLGLSTYLTEHIHTGCNRRNGPNLGRVFIRSNYTDITQNTYIQSSMVTEILAREVWNFDSYYSLIDYQIYIETGRNMWFL